MKETKPEIRVISVGKGTAQVVIHRPAQRGRKSSETRHLLASAVLNGWTDRQGNIYQLNGNTLHITGHVSKA